MLVYLIEWPEVLIQTSVLKKTPLRKQQEKPSAIDGYQE